MIKQLKQLRNYFLRKVIYRRYQIGTNFHAGIRVRLWAKKQLIIGNNFYIGRDSLIETNAIIGNNVIFGNRVALIGRYDHHYQEPGTPTRLASQIRDANYSWKGLNSTIIIEDDVWVGYGTILLGGIKIGTGSIIAAGSVVTKNVESYSIYGGVPARKISDRFASSEDLELHLNIMNENPMV